MMANLIYLVVLVIFAVAVQGCDPRSGKHPPGSAPLYGKRPPPGSDGAYGPPGPGRDCRRSTRGVSGARGPPMPRGPPGEARERLCEPESVNRGSAGSRGAPGPAGGVSIDRSSINLHLLLSSGESPETIFATLDLDEDNYVTLSEWISEGGDARAFARFLDDFDRNDDGKIDFGEARRISVNLR